MKAENLCSLEKVRKNNLPILKLVEDIYSDHFGQSLDSLYLIGSAGRGDDVPGISDLDFIGVIDRDVTEKDKQFLEDKEKVLKGQAEIDVSAVSSTSLADDELWQFVIESDGLLLVGNEYQITKESPDIGLDLAKLLAAEFPKIYRKQKEWLAKTQTHEWYIKQSRFLAKKTLRLLGLCVTAKERVYARTVEKDLKFIERFLPEYADIAKRLLALRSEPNSIEADFKQQFAMTEKVYTLAKKVGIIKE